MPKTKILVAEDEVRMRRLIKDFLEAAGYTVLEAANGEEALELFYQQKDIALVVLDVMMPKVNGLQVCREIRSTSDVAIMMLTALAQEGDEVMGFEMGADEYITKPFSPKIFVTRVEALLRRRGELREATLSLGGICVDCDAHSVFVNGQEVHLSLKEYDLLVFMMENRGITLSREKILDRVWNFDYFGDARTIDTHITKLRKKLGDCGDALQTVRGVGYKFEVEG